MVLLQVAQRATDLNRAEQFYTMLLGRTASARFDPPGLLFFDLDGVRLLLDGNAPSALLYLKVADVEAEVGRLRAAGVEVLTEPHQIFVHDDDILGPAGAQEWQAFVRDSEGNTVGLIEWRVK